QDFLVDRFGVAQTERRRLFRVPHSAYFDESLVLHPANPLTGWVRAFDPDPVRLPRKFVIYLGRGFEVCQICFLQIASPLGVPARGFFAYEAMCFTGWYTQVNDQVFLRQSVAFVFELL